MWGFLLFSYCKSLNTQEILICKMTDKIKMICTDEKTPLFRPDVPLPRWMENAKEKRSDDQKRNVQE